MNNREKLTLLELNRLVREVIETEMPQEYWVEAELSECRESRGHCYMELIERDSRAATPVAKASAKCWASKWAVIRPYFERTTGQQLRAGMKVLLKVYPQFHEAFGFSWIVTDIDPTFTLGDQARRRQEIIRQLKQEGVFDLQRELRLPLFCLNIAVISSQTAAGYGDFSAQLADSPFAFRTRLFPAIMQGEGVEQSIIAALNRIYEGDGGISAATPLPSKGRGQGWGLYYPVREEDTDPTPVPSPTREGRAAVSPDPLSLRQKYSLSSLLSPLSSETSPLSSYSHPTESFDCVVIIRGGGATSDMSGFDTLALAENVANFPLPIITGIGHDRDESILDMVSHLRVKTPTAAAAFLIDHAQAVFNALDDAQIRIARHAQQQLANSKMLLANLNIRISNLFSVVRTRQEARLDSLFSHLLATIQQKVTKQQATMTQLQERMPMLISRRLTAERHQLQLLEEKAKSLDPAQLLRRGYSITLKDGHAIRDAADLHPGDLIETRLENGTIHSTVIPSPTSNTQHP